MRPARQSRARAPPAAHPATATTTALHTVLDQSTRWAIGSIVRGAGLYPQKEWRAAKYCSTSIWLAIFSLYRAYSFGFVSRSCKRGVGNVGNAG